MRRRGPWLVAALTLLCTLLSSCADEDDDRVALDDVIDPTVEMPDDAAGVRLGGELGKLADERDFCAVAAEIPLRWFNDAVVPVQIAVDAYGSAQDVPPEVEDPISRLVEFGETWLEWSLGGGGDRPQFGEELQADVITVAEAALANCPDLPLVIGPDPAAAPAAWDDMSDEELAAHCEWIREVFEGYLAEYEEITGEPARHSILVDAVVPYAASDWFGIVHDPDAGPRVAPVPGGGCDLE